MPVTPYDLVQDEKDLRVPLHAEQAFFHGITFQAKFVGWEEVPRPDTRVEIVQAMRRIRYECKVQNLKKRKVAINISVNGVRVVLKKRRKKKKNFNGDSEEIELLYHPIYRIFYVSHDSSDLKIFSYIARDAKTDTFKCSVFKSHKKSQAMRIVRTVGQAFEVCHKLNLHKNSLDQTDEHSDVSSVALNAEKTSEQQQSDVEEDCKKDLLNTALDVNAPPRFNHLELELPLSTNKSSNMKTDNVKSLIKNSSPSQEILKLKDQLEQQALQTQQALTQLMLVREQLISETNARLEAQARTQQLLQQNRELLEHLMSLGVYTEQQTAGQTPDNFEASPQSQLQRLLHPANTNTSNSLVAINQQISNLGSINQQLTSLSQQLGGGSGATKQNQNVRNLQSLGSTTTLQSQSYLPQEALPSPTYSAPLHQSQLKLNMNVANANSVNTAGGSALYNNLLSTLSPLQMQQLSAQQHDAISKDIYQANQELLNRLQALNLSNNTSMTLPLSSAALSTSTTQQTPSPTPHNSFFFANPMSYSPSNHSSKFNFLSSSSPIGPFTRSPMGTINRNSYSNSPITDEMRLSIEKNLNSLDEQLKPLAPLSAATSNANLIGSSSTPDNSRSSSTVDSANFSQTTAGVSAKPRFNTVMLQVTDETGNVTNQRKVSATPSFITRSTSEKVPNRSQIMSQVQRTAWARHTTK